MSVELQCPCGKRLVLTSGAAGGQGACPICGRVLDIPAPEPSAPAPPAAAPPADTSTALTDDPSAQPAARPTVTEITGEPGVPESLVGEGNDLSPPEPPAYRLASPGQVGGAAFLGGPVAGFLLLARNYAKLGRPAACWAAVAGGALLTAAAVMVGSMLPESGHHMNFLFALPLWLGTYAAAKGLQERTFNDHKSRGGEQASGWVVLGFVVLGAGLTFGSAFAIAALYEAATSDQEYHVTDKEVIYYAGGVTEDEAHTLGRVLRNRGLFDGVGDKSVRLRKEGFEDYILSVYLLFGFDDLGVQRLYRDLARELSEAFGGAPVRVELCDTSGALKTPLPAQRGP